jgi:hypothetical protein
MAIQTQCQTRGGIDAQCHIDLMKDPAGEIDGAESAKHHTIAVTNAPSAAPNHLNLGVKTRHNK